MRAYWWNKQPNFGDDLTHLLLPDATWSEPEDAEVVVVGSILEHLPLRWTGIVAGAGKLFEYSPLDLSNAYILAVRGALTARWAAGRDCVLGDPGLLAEDFVRWSGGGGPAVLPHWSDNELEHRYGSRMRIIRPNRSALTVIHDIARCDTLITSSLHGIIVADSLGIPVQPEPFPNLPNEGGDFKHRDYSSALGIRNEFGKMRQAPRDRVEEAQRSLREVLRVLA